MKFCVRMHTFFQTYQVLKLQPNPIHYTMSRQQSYVIPMIIIGALFFVFGFVTWINGTLIPYLKIACQLTTDFESFLV